MQSPIQLIGLAAVSTVVVSVYQNIFVMHERLITVPIEASTQVTDSMSSKLGRAVNDDRSKATLELALKETDQTASTSQLDHHRSRSPLRVRYQRSHHTVPQ